MIPAPLVSLAIGVESFLVPYSVTVGSLLLGAGALAVGICWRAGEEIARRYDLP